MQNIEAQKGVDMNRKANPGDVVYIPVRISKVSEYATGDVEYELVHAYRLNQPLSNATDQTIFSDVDERSFVTADMIPGPEKVGAKYIDRMGGHVYDNCPLKRYIPVTVALSEVQRGDKINIDLKGFGYFTATAVQVTDDVLFMFDECITKQFMNKNDTNHGGFDASDLGGWLQRTVLSAFPAELKRKILDISLPSYGMIFGHDDWYERMVEPDEYKQLPTMQKRINRIKTYKGELTGYWLKNATRGPCFDQDFIYVDYDGDAYHDTATTIHNGVCPIFRIKR